MMESESKWRVGWVVHIYDGLLSYITWTTHPHYDATFVAVGSPPSFSGYPCSTNTHGTLVCLIAPIKRRR